MDGPAAAPRAHSGARGAAFRAVLPLPPGAARLRLSGLLAARHRAPAGGADLAAAVGPDLGAAGDLPMGDLRAPGDAAGRVDARPAPDLRATADAAAPDGGVLGPPGTIAFEAAHGYRAMF